MTIREPVALGTFFAYPSGTEQGACLPCWIAAGGVLRRLTFQSKRAFCAVLEGAIERSVIPTLTADNWPGTLEDLSNVSPGEGIFSLVPIPSALSDPSKREDISGALVRGRDRTLWLAAISSAFSFLGASGNLDLRGSSDIERARIFPFVLGDIGGNSAGFVPSAAISVNVPCALCEAVWDDGEGAANPLYSGTRELAPRVIRDAVDNLLRNVGSLWHEIETPAAEDCNLATVFRAHSELASRYDSDTAKNWWTPPTAQHIQEGPTDVKVRRANVAYGIAQYLLSLASRTVCRFSYRLDFVHVERTVRTDYLLVVDADGALSAEEYDTSDETERSHSSSMQWSRTRSLITFGAGLNLFLKHPNTAQSPYAMTRQQLVAIDPNFERGVFVDIPVPSLSGLGTDPGSEPGLMTCITAVTNTSAGTEHECMGMWPHPEAGDYIERGDVILVDGLIDTLSNEGGNPRGSVYSVRVQEFTTPGGLAQTVKAHADWLIGAAGVGTLELPEAAKPDNSYLKRYGQERFSRIKISYHIDASPRVTKDGEEFFLPFAAWFSEQLFSSFNLEGDDWVAHGRMFVGPDPEQSWGGVDALDEGVSHRYGEALAQVRWAWRAMPTAD